VKAVFIKPFSVRILKEKIREILKIQAPLVPPL
jgi:hypothetical protein